MIVRASTGGSHTTASSASRRPSVSRTPARPSGSGCGSAAWIAPAQATRASFTRALHEGALQAPDAVDFDARLLAGPHPRCRRRGTDGEDVSGRERHELRDVRQQASDAAHQLRGGGLLS